MEILIWHFINYPFGITSKSAFDTSSKSRFGILLKTTLFRCFEDLTWTFRIRNCIALGVNSGGLGFQISHLCKKTTPEKPCAIAKFLFFLSCGAMLLPAKSWKRQSAWEIFTKTCFLFEENILCVVGQVEKWHQKYIKVHIGLEVHDHRIDLERHLHIFKSRLCEKYAFKKYIFGKYAFQKYNFGNYALKWKVDKRTWDETRKCLAADVVDFFQRKSATARWIKVFYMLINISCFCFDKD